MAIHDSSFGRVIGALVAPEKTFQAIREKPSWLVATFVLLLLTLGVGFALQDRSDPAEVTRLQMERFGMEPSPEQMEQIEKQSANQPPAMKAVGLVVGMLVTVGFYLVLAAIFLVAFKLSGSEIDFRSSLATTVHGMLPLGVAALLNIPLILSRQEVRAEEVLSGGVLVSSLRGLAPEDSPVLTSLLGSLDFFMIWAVVLLIIGFRTVARVSTTTATAVLLVLWGILVLGKAGFVAIVN